MDSLFKKRANSMLFLLFVLVIILILTSIYLNTNYNSLINLSPDLENLSFKRPDYLLFGIIIGIIIFLAAFFIIWIKLWKK